MQAAFKFALDHNLCISVAGTGHEYLNRHSCEDASGFFIRTSLMKDSKFNFNDKRGPAGTITLTPGLNWAQAHFRVSQVNRFITSGWAPDVVCNESP